MGEMSAAITTILLRAMVRDRFVIDGHENTVFVKSEADGVSEGIC